MASFEHLRLFRDVAQFRSLSRAAAANGVSQPAASQHIHELELRLGAKLLDRSTRPLTLTPAGRLYAELCRDILHRQEAFDVALEALRNRVEGTVRVASIYSVGLSEMSDIKEEFARRCPDAHLEVEYLRPDKVYEAVLADAADLGIVSYAQASRQLQVRPWREERMALAAAPSHPLAKRSVVRAADIEGQDYVAFDDDLTIRHEIDRFLRDWGVEVNRTMHFDNVQMIAQAVALGAGVSILPERALRGEIALRRLTVIPLESGLVRPLGILHRRRKRFHLAAQRLLELLEEQ